MSFQPGSPTPSTTPEGRLPSAEELAAQIAKQATHFSPNPDGSLPPVDPSRRLLSSPATPSLFLAASPNSTSPSLLKTPNPRSSQKRRGGAVDQAKPTQVVTPPPSARKSERKLAPKPKMQNEPAFDNVDFSEIYQPHQMTSMMNGQSDVLGYPMSAPVNAPPILWDPSAPLDMDMDFGSQGIDPFQQAVFSQHAPASFDWGAGMDLFHDPNVLPPPSSNQENIQPARQEQQQLAPKMALSVQTPGEGGNLIPTTYPATTAPGPLTLPGPGPAVDPELLFGRPQTPAADAELGNLNVAGLAEDVIAGYSNESAAADGRRSVGARPSSRNKLLNPVYASSPIKAPARPGLSRSMSENRGRKSRSRASLPALSLAPRPVPSGSRRSGLEACRAGVRSEGRTSPPKNQQHLSELACIPEVASLPRSRTSVRFTIDSQGRARAETTVVQESPGVAPGLSRRHSTGKGGGRSHWEPSDEESSTDDEPIILPSRNASFRASFALPDPRKPVGSIFHSPKKSFGNVSTTSAATGTNGGESEAETVMEEPQKKGGDATSELRKVVETRQRRARPPGSAQSQRFMSANRPRFKGDLMSPTGLRDSSLAPEGRNVRCVCNRNEAVAATGYMVQWYDTESQP